MDEQEVYKTYQEGKKQAEASGIDALTRDIGRTGKNIAGDAKYAVDKTVDTVDDDVTEIVKKTGKDIDNTATGIKNEVKQDIGIGNADKGSRYDAGAELADKVKESEKDEDVYVSRKRARYM